eukprot:241787-Pelagomonas_calceolata.AAC.1
MTLRLSLRGAYKIHVSLPSLLVYLALQFNDRQALTSQTKAEALEPQFDAPPPPSYYLTPPEGSNLLPSTCECRPRKMCT